MNEHTKFRFLLLILLPVLTFSMACGGDQAAETAAPAQAPTEAPAAAPDAAEVRTTEGGVVLVSGAELMARIEAGDAPVILDVRRPDEFAEGHVPGAINISHDELADRLAEIDAARDAELVVYCRSGRRAGIAEALLAEQGFTNLKHLDGDMLAWTADGRLTEKPKQ